MYIGLDLGTSGVKSVLFDLQGSVLLRSCRSYPLVELTEGLELNPEVVWRAVLDVLKETAAGGFPVKAIGISSLGEACIPVAKDGRALANAILPADKRGRKELEVFLKRLPEQQIVEITGLPVNGTYSLCKIMWLRENRPAVFEQVWKFMLFGDYIAYKLTGNAATSPSLASRTMTMNLIENDYSYKILSEADISKDLFSPILSAGIRIGKLGGEIARETGLPENTEVFSCGHDQPCAALGAGILTKGQAVDTTGTSECITPVMGNQPFSASFIRETNLACEPFFPQGSYSTMAFTHTAGRLLNWFVKDILGGEAACREDVYRVYDAMCRETPSGLLILPHFSGSGTPYMDALSTGAIAGLTLRTTKAEIYQALMESVTYEMKFNLDLLRQSGISVQTMAAVGGGANSEIWLRYKANIYGIPVYTLACGEASAMGAAIIAAVGNGEFSSLPEAVQAMVHTSRKFEPEEKIVRKFASVYETYQGFYQAMKVLWERKENQ